MVPRSTGRKSKNSVRSVSVASEMSLPRVSGCTFPYTCSEFVVGASEKSGTPSLCRRGAVEHLLKQAGQLFHGLLHLQPDQAERRSIVEQHDEDDSPGDVREIHRFLLALMEERVEVRFPNELRQLIVGAEIGGGERREGGRVELRLFAHRRDELAAPVHDERTARVALVEEAVQRFRDGSEVVLRERPARGAYWHEGPRSSR